MKKAEPDSGWSWVICFCCFSIYLVLFGIYRTSGILLVAFIHEYNVSREESSWPIFLSFSVVDLTGLIAGPIGQKFGIRPITIAGSLIAAAGVSLCYFANSLIFITVSFGVIFGLGYGMAYTLMPVIMNEYFLKHRATANGIAQSGSCIGSVIFPPLYEHLMNTYGLNGCLLLTGGIILQLAIAGALMRPPSWLKSLNFTESNVRIDKSSVILNNDEIIPLQPYNISDSCRFPNEIKERTLWDDLEVDQTESLENGYKHLKFSQLEEKSQSEIIAGISYEPNNSDKARYSALVNNVTNKCEPVISDTEYSSKKLFECTKQTVKPEPKTDNIGETLECVCSTKYDQCRDGVNELTLKKDYENKHTFKEKSLNPECESEKNEQKIIHSTLKNCKEDAENFVSIERSNSGVVNSFKRVLTCPMFYVIAFSNVAFFAAEETFYVINADFFIDKGVVETDVKYIIIAFSICDLAGRLCFGWVTDRGYLSRSHFLILCLVAASVAFFCFPIGNGYIYLMIFNSVYGLILGAANIVFALLPAEYLDMDVQEVAFGMIGFLAGILTLLRTLIIGYFRDNLGSYTIMFYIMGVLCVITAAIWFLKNSFVKPKSKNISNSTPVL